MDNAGIAMADKPKKPSAAPPHTGYPKPVVPGIPLAMGQHTTDRPKPSGDDPDPPRLTQTLGTHPTVAGRTALAERMNRRARGLQDCASNSNRPLTKRRGGLELYLEAQTARNQAVRPPNP